MDPEEAKECIERDGFVVLRSVLPREAALRLGEIANERWRLRPDQEDHFLHEFDFVNSEPAFRELIDQRSILEVATLLLGYNIYIYHCHLTVTAPMDRPDGDAGQSYLWHQDGGRIPIDLGGSSAPRIALKVGFLLSDAPTPSHGSTFMIRGSHTGFGPLPGSRNSMWPDATAIPGTAGDCVIFDTRIWHTRSTNSADGHRVLASLAYAPRWIRPRDHLVPPEITDNEVSPVRAQLLGAGSQALDFHVNQEMPLQSWLNGDLVERTVSL